MYLWSVYLKESDMTKSSGDSKSETGYSYSE